MLYDPKWEVKTKPDVFSLESLIAWLEKQPADRAYDFCDPYNCVIAQYMLAHRKDPLVRTIELHILGWNDIAQDYSLPQDWTFGGALTRARAALTAGK